MELIENPHTHYILYSKDISETLQLMKFLANHMSPEYFNVVGGYLVVYKPMCDAKNLDIPNLIKDL